MPDSTKEGLWLTEVISRRALKVKKLLICDIDGTLTGTKSGNPFKESPKDVIALPGAVEAIANLSSRGFICVGASNQGGIEAGHKSLEDTIAEMRHTLELLPQLTAIYFCPDFKGQHCWLVAREGESPIHTAWASPFVGTFRKPNAGMLRAAILNHCGDKKPKDCWMIGDRPEDEEAADSAGVSFMAADIFRDRFTKGAYRVSPD
jgi:D-glycero-D-manno-heptose 1,7-bisphosphate phosphatase